MPQQIHILIDGVEVNPDTMTDLMKSMVVRSMFEQLQQKLHGVACPDHQIAPEVFVAITHGRQQVSVQGCCQRLVDMTTRAITNG